jgi:hypothetical protein
VTSIRARTAQAAWQAYQGTEFRDLAAAVHPTALRNLLAAASEAEVLEELFILLEYQVGRNVLDKRMCEYLFKSIEAQVKLLTSSSSTDKDRLDVARSYLTHVVRLHRAITPQR